MVHGQWSIVNSERLIELVCGILPIQTLWTMVYGPWTILSLKNVFNQNTLVA